MNTYEKPSILSMSIEGQLLDTLSIISEQGDNSQLANGNMIEVETSPSTNSVWDE